MTSMLTFPLFEGNSGLAYNPHCRRHRRMRHHLGRRSLTLALTLMEMVTTMKICRMRRVNNFGARSRSQSIPIDPNRAIRLA
jgi:hypothetical protein